MTMNNQQARVIDPILTNIARGYKDQQFVSTLLFPIVPVMQRGGKIISFGAEEFGDFATGRAPGSAIKRVNYGYAGEPYALEQQALAGQVAVEHAEEAAAVPGINQGTIAVRKTMTIVQRAIERKAAALATDADNYGTNNKLALSGNDRWDKAASKPVKKVEEAKEAVATAIGLEPNLMVLGLKVARALRNNEDVRDRIKYSSGGMVDEVLLAQYFGVDQVVVGRARGGKPGAFESLWGENVILAYTAISGIADMGCPSYGYTYRLNKYPLVEQAYYDDTHRSWLYSVVTEDTPVIAGADGGFLFTSVVS